MLNRARRASIPTPSSLSLSSSLPPSFPPSLLPCCSPQLSLSLSPTPSPPPSLAVLLVGGVRDFDATGPSIVDHLIAAFRPCDVFVNAPLDDNTAKLAALARAGSLASLRVFANLPVDERALQRALQMDTPPEDMLESRGSPNGVQVRARDGEMREGEERGRGIETEGGRGSRREGECVIAARTRGISAYNGMCE